MEKVIINTKQGKREIALLKRLVKDINLALKEHLALDIYKDGKNYPVDIKVSLNDTNKIGEWWKIRIDSKYR